MTKEMENHSFFFEPDLDFDTFYPLVLPPVDESQNTVKSPQQEEPSLEVKEGFRNRSSLACLPCRTRHLKCDGAKTCGRCEADNTTCVYAKSRRGGKRKRGSYARGTNLIEDALEDAHLQALTLPRKRGGLGCDHLKNLLSTKQGSDENTLVASSDSQSAGTHQDTNNKYLDLYYENFHDSHPVALPKWNLEARLKANPSSLDHLLPVLEFIGSIYEADGQSSTFRQTAFEALNQAEQLPYNAFSVQALLLFALALHCSDEYEVADAFLDQAIDIALSIQMNRRQFTQENGEGDPTLEESWRRTYWSLFLIDTLFAAITHRTTHRLQTVLSDVDLPCEDQEYRNNVCDVSLV